MILNQPTHRFLLTEGPDDRSIRFQDSILTNTSKADPAGTRLHLKQEVELVCERRTIPANIYELLTYCRVYFFYSMYILEDSVLFSNFKVAMWMWILLTALCILPLYYVSIVYAVFSPQSHYFLSKMLPILYGTNVIKVITSVSTMTNMYNTYAGTLERLVLALFWRSPWNRCENETVIIRNETIRCFELTEFLNLQLNTDLNVSSRYRSPWFAYETKQGWRNFTLAQLTYAKPRETFAELEMGSSYETIVLCNIFFISVFIYAKDEIFKPFIWKILNYVNMCQIFVYACIWVHMIYLKCSGALIVEDFKRYENYRKVIDSTADIWALSETFTSPPIIHVLVARTRYKIVPSSSSLILAVMNSLYFFTIGRMRFSMNAYIKKVFAVNLNDNAHFYAMSEKNTYCLYFSTFYFGELYYFIFLLLKCLAKTLCLVISVNILFESMVCEWKWMNKWSLLIMTSIYNFFYTNPRTIIFQILNGKFIVCCAYENLLQMFAIIFIYPFERFSDDVSFQFGYPPTAICKVIFEIGFFCCFLIPCLAPYAISSYFWPVIIEVQINQALLPLSLILLIGALYITVKMVIFEKKKWQQLFLPYSNWGPYDHRLRLQRKQYREVKYIRSQAPRDLSRTMMKRKNSKMFRIKVNYNEIPSPLSEVAYIDEKKKK